ncbi:hypothetical protein BgiMline_002782, partial [Biomphalaria glabrata]
DVLTLAIKLPDDGVDKDVGRRYMTSPHRHLHGLGGVSALADPGYSPPRWTVLRCLISSDGLVYSMTAGVRITIESPVDHPNTKHYLIT